MWWALRERKMEMEEEAAGGRCRRFRPGLVQNGSIRGRRAEEGDGRVAVHTERESVYCVLAGTYSRYYISK